MSCICKNCGYKVEDEKKITLKNSLYTKSGKYDNIKLTNEIYERIIKEGKIWCDPHAIGNLRQIKESIKIFPKYSKEILYNAFLFIGKKKDQKI